MTARAKAAPSLVSLIEPGSFTEIWCRSTWLNDELELRRDHGMLRSLLKAAASATSAAEMRPWLQLAVDLFKLHAAIVYQMLGMGRLRPSIEHVLMLIEQLEGTDPDNPLYIAQAADLKMQLELLMVLEDDSYEHLSHRSSVSELDPDLLQARLQLLREADTLLKAGASGAPAMQRLC